MKEWMLTVEKRIHIIQSDVNCMGCIEEAIEAQVCKMVEWLWQDCKDDNHYHRNFTDTDNRMKEVFRKDCQTCMEQFRKEAT